VDPEIAIISVGHNQWDHPHQETIDRLNAAGVIVRRTDHYGTIVITTDGEDYHVTTEYGPTATPTRTASPTATITATGTVTATPTSTSTPTATPTVLWKTFVPFVVKPGGSGQIEGATR